LLEFGKVHKNKALFEGCAFAVLIECFIDYGAVKLAKGLNFNGLNFNGLNFNGLNFNGLNFNGIRLLFTANCRVCGNLFKPSRCSGLQN